MRYRCSRWCRIDERSPHHVTAARFGQKMGDMTMTDALIAVLSDPFEGFHMRLFDTDEHVRQGTTVDSLAALRPIFKSDGTVTAGNAFGINDGAAAVVLASQRAVAAHNLKPLARILGWGHAGVEPHLMGIGPVKAVPIALARSRLTLDKIDVIESNEAFAAQACAVAQALGFDPQKVNPNGSGISLGHPVGATGAILTVKTLYKLVRTGGRYGLITLCIGGDQGIAMTIERM